jgi:vacuolar-type H+-ATPase subunit E/Vma4
VGTKELIEKIIADARERVRIIEADTAIRLRAITDQGQEISARLRAENKARIRSRLDAIMENARSQAELEAKKIILAAKWRLISQIAEQVKQQIVKSPDYGEILKRLAAKYAIQEATVHLSPADTRQFGLQLKVKLGEPVPISGGMIVRRAREEIDFSLDSVLNQVLEEMITELATILFP